MKTVFVKTALSIGLIGMLFVGLCSCNNKIADDSMTKKASYREVEFVDMSTIHGVAMVVAPITHKIDNHISRSEMQDTTNTAITKDDLELLETEMQPFVEVGEAVRDNLVEAECVEDYDFNVDECLTAEEKAVLNDMTDAELAAFGFALSVAYEKEALEKLDYEPGYQVSYTSQKLIHCLMVATGIDDIATLFKSGIELGCVSGIVKGTQGLITAATAKKIAFALIKRYAGYVGVAYMIYDFGICMSE